MIGRAGRAGFVDTTGESILLFKGPDKQKVFELITGPMKRCDSSFQGDDSKAIRVLVLSLVGLHLTHYGSQIFAFFKQTLFYIQHRQIRRVANERHVEMDADLVPDEFEVLSNALVYLLDRRLIKINSGGEQSTVCTDPKGLFFASFEVTPLGMAAIKGNIDLDYVHQLYADLKSGLKCLVLSNYLHLLYLCTPYDLVNSLMNVDLDAYINKVNFVFHL